MSIFGDETITVDESPETSGQGEETAGEAEDLDTDLDDSEGEDADLDGDGDNDDDEQADDEEDTSPEDGQGEGLILGKFKTQEDLAKAYQNLQREFTKSRQPAAQQPPTQQQVPAQQDGQPADLNQVFWERFRDNPLSTLQALVGMVVEQRTAPIFEERQTAAVSANLQAVASEYKQIQTPEGMSQLFERVNEIAQEFGNPALAQNPSQRILRMAAAEVFGDTKAQAFQKGKQAGRQESEQTRQAKKGLGAPNGARRQQETEKTTEQAMKDSILEAGKGMGLFG